MSTNDFSTWSQEDFARWLHENYPKTNDRWVEFTFHVRHTPDLVQEATIADDYETCMNELAWQLSIYAPGLPEEQWNIVINPAKRRKKRQMKLYASQS